MADELPVDLPTIQRTLRPIRSKLQALQKICALPSGKPTGNPSIATRSQSSQCQSWLLRQGCFPRELKPSQVPERPEHSTKQAPLKIVYKRGAKSNVTTTNTSSTSVTNNNSARTTVLATPKPLDRIAPPQSTPDSTPFGPAFPLPKTGHGLSRSLQAASQHHSHLPSPVRRHGIYLKMFFQEALRKYARFEPANVTNTENTLTSTPIRKPRNLRRRIPSLAELACYAMGSQIEHLEELEEQEEIYEWIPGHWRRFVLLEHLRHLCTAHISVLEILQDLIECCYQRGAYFQAMGLIWHALTLQPSDKLLHWLLHRSRRMYRLSQFLDGVQDALSVPWLVSSSRLFSIGHALSDADLAYRFAWKAVRCFVQDPTRSDPPSHAGTSSLESWTALLIHRSFSLRRTKLDIQEWLSLLLEMDGKVSADVSCVLALRILSFLYRAKADGGFVLDDPTDSTISARCVSLVERMAAGRKSTILYLFYSFGNIDRVFSLAKLMAHLALRKLALELMRVMAQEYSTLEKECLEVKVSFAECRRFLNDLEAETMDGAQRRYYDPDFDVWVLLTSPGTGMQSSSSAADLFSPTKRQPIFLNSFVNDLEITSGPIDAGYWNDQDEDEEDVLFENALQDENMCAFDDHLEDPLEIPVGFLDDRYVPEEVDQNDRELFSPLQERMPKKRRVAATPFRPSLFDECLPIVSSPKSGEGFLG